MEVSFRREIETLRLGAGQTFHGEGIMAVTKALLQSRVAYVGGYQGAPVSHLMDVLLQAEDLLTELGIHLETCTNEAAAAAMLAASINYPIRGAVTWKSIVGTNVAADALSNLSSAGVMGGALIIVGEDYGEGASVIQERTQAYAVKSSLWLLDPRPELPTIVRMVEKGFELSEASNTPVILELRIRACHVFGGFEASDNRASEHSAANRFAEPARFDYARLSHPPVTFVQEADKVNRRLPAARAFIREHRLNERFGPAEGDIGIVVQGGMFNVLNGRLAEAGLSDAYGNLEIPTHVLNVTYPLVPGEITEFCAGKRAVLVVEEGGPDFIEKEIGQILRKADLNTVLHGKDMLPMAGEYSPVVVAQGLSTFLSRYGRNESARLDDWVDAVSGHSQAVGRALSAPLPPRPPTFCTGCPERPVFSAMKLLRQDTGPVHVAADIGCHAFATFPPFSQGNSILGYGMSLASAAAVSGTQAKRPIAVMGDGGFWHNGLLTGVAGSVFNQDDSVLVIFKNGYTSATGVQDVPSSRPHQEGRGRGLDIEQALKSLGVGWVRTVHSYGVSAMRRALREALTAPGKGPRVIIADGECQLARQRRVRPANAKALAEGKRVVRTRFWVDPDVCTGDHSCIRLSGCPSLTVKASGDPLKPEPVAHVNNDCVGCGLCGEVSHAAQLCPSFARIEIIQNPNAWDRFRARLSGGLIGLFGGYAPVPPSPRGGVPSPIPAE
jgi:indolepyruvate ferredoxin oxidoreductase, alpha subunit